MTPHSNSKATHFISDVCIDTLEHPRRRDKALQVLESTEEKKHVITEEENQRVLRKIDLQ